jgi:hypothetical protein
MEWLGLPGTTPSLLNVNGKQQPIAAGQTINVACVAAPKPRKQFSSGRPSKDCPHRCKSEANVALIATAICLDNPTTN